MQAQSSPITATPTRKSWAFAATRQPDRRLLSTRNRAVITAVSKEAKHLGVQTGMHVKEAKQLIPNLRILFYRGGNYAKTR